MDGIWACDDRYGRYTEVRRCRDGIVDTISAHSAHVR